MGGLSVKVQLYSRHLFHLPLIQERLLCQVGGGSARRAVIALYDVHGKPIRQQCAVSLDVGRSDDDQFLGREPGHEKWVVCACARVRVRVCVRVRVRAFVRVLTLAVVCIADLTEHRCNAGILTHVGTCQSSSQRRLVRNGLKIYARRDRPRADLICHACS